MNPELDVTGRVGPALAVDGSTALTRLDKAGGLVMGPALGKYFEATARGNLFMAAIAVDGVDPSEALDDVPPLALWNPPHSGVLCAIQQVWVGYVSGLLEAGTLAHAVNPSQLTAPSGGTELVPQSGLLGTLRSKTRAYTGSTLSATAVIVRPSLHLGAPTSIVTPTPAFPKVAYDDVDGSVVISPGKAWSYQGITATGGTTPLLLIGVVFLEVPMV